MVINMFFFTTSPGRFAASVRRLSGAGREVRIRIYLPSTDWCFFSPWKRTWMESRVRIKGKKQGPGIFSASENLWAGFVLSKHLPTLLFKEKTRRPLMAPGCPPMGLVAHPQFSPDCYFKGPNTTFPNHQIPTQSPTISNTNDFCGWNRPITNDTNKIE